MQVWTEWLCARILQFSSGALLVFFFFNYAYSIVWLYHSFFNQIPTDHPILDALILQQLELPSSYYPGAFVPSPWESKTNI